MCYTYIPSILVCASFRAQRESSEKVVFGGSEMSSVIFISGKKMGSSVTTLLSHATDIISSINGHLPNCLLSLWSEQSVSLNFMPQSHVWLAWLYISWLAVPASCLFWVSDTWGNVEEWRCGYTHHSALSPLKPQLDSIRFSNQTLKGGQWFFSYFCDPKLITK